MQDLLFEISNIGVIIPQNTDVVNKILQKNKFLSFFINNIDYRKIGFMKFSHFKLANCKFEIIKFHFMEYYIIRLF